MNDRRRGSLIAGAVFHGARAILSWKIIAAAAAIAALFAALALGAGGVAMFGTLTSSASVQAACAPGGAAVRVTVSGVPEGGFGDYSYEGMQRAAIVLETAESLGVGRQGQLIALITAMQESTLGDNPSTASADENGDAGLFQQRIIPGWYGSQEQVNDPAYGTRAFIEGHDITYAGPESAGPPGYHLPGLKDIKGWETMSPGAAAQAVQVSAFPDEYDKHIPQAEAIMEHLAGASITPGASDAGGAPAAAPSDTGGTSDAGGAAAVDCTGGGSGEWQGATTMDQLPKYPMPAGCFDQTPLFGEYGPGGLNGNLPSASLCPLPGATDRDGRAQPRAVAAYIAMNADFKKEFGHDLLVTSTYRTYEKQVSTKASKGRLAATPGWSNHGFGLAIDVGGTIEEKRWIQTNGPKYGWWHPLWARPDGRKPENWHYEYGTWLVAPEYKGMDTSLVSY